MKIKKLILLLIILNVLFSIYGCEDDPIDPIDPIDPPIVEKTSLELAFEAFEDVSSYTMNITFNSSSENVYTTLIKMSETSAEITALDETIYYESDGNLCYVYEFKATSWQKSPTACSNKTSQELSFLTGFDISYFEETSENTYTLKTEYYDSLTGFLQSSTTTDFILTIDDDQFSTISFTMERNDFTFDITILLSNFNQTTVTVPQV
jgi:hypothetical protein